MSLIWLGSMLACCAMPPRVEDRSTPVKAYETFRGAIARAEFSREWDCLSDPMRHRLGLESRGDWKDARAVVLDQGHILIKGICRSSVEGEPETLADGRVVLQLDFPLGYEGRVWMRAVPVLRAFVAGEQEPRIYEVLPALRLKMGDSGLVIVVPKNLREWMDTTAEFTRVEAAIEWFLDDFAAGDETAASVRKDLEKGP